MVMCGTCKRAIFFPNFGLKIALFLYESIDLNVSTESRFYRSSIKAELLAYAVLFASKKSVLI